MPFSSGCLQGYAPVSKRKSMTWGCGWTRFHTIDLPELRAEQAKVGGRFAGHCTSKRQPPQTNLTRRTVLSLNRRRRLPLSEHETYENPQGDEPGRRQTDPYRPTGGLGAGGDEVDQHWFADFCLQHLRK